ncbi:Os02g0301750 [Oryza sativa Japonica Group]|uniref:Os02g0301750 protein n=1 Tax=Oryza sativa subsp. japonica TaxID=39947 RepID=A0A0P0VI09_ORYSJ|nr:Os02g0301750 [Oryza sativa Japonica Group]
MAISPRVKDEVSTDHKGINGIYHAGLDQTNDGSYVLCVERPVATGKTIRMARQLTQIETNFDAYVPCSAARVPVAGAMLQSSCREKIKAKQCIRIGSATAYVVMLVRMPDELRSSKLSNVHPFPCSRSISPFMSITSTSGVPAVRSTPRFASSSL